MRMKPNMEKGSTPGNTGISTREAGSMTNWMAWDNTTLFLEIIIRASGRTPRNMAKASSNTQMEISMRANLPKTFTMALAYWRGKLDSLMRDSLLKTSTTAKASYNTQTEMSMKVSSIRAEERDKGLWLGQTAAPRQENGGWIKPGINDDQNSITQLAPPGNYHCCCWCCLSCQDWGWRYR